jgi:D-amino-acid oxidase
VRAVVVGAGVVGLSCAVRLAETGHEVHVLARDLPLETTSSIAAAWWYPYLAAPLDRVVGWAAATYDHLDGLASADAGAGVRQRESVQVLRGRLPDPPWAASVSSFRTTSDVPAGYAGGWAFTAPVADMSVYLPYLAARLASAGGTITRAALSGLPRGADVVVNATGLAARSLTGDPTLVPVRGQVVRLVGVSVERVWLDDGEPTGDDAPQAPTYVVPREHEVVVGGTAEAGQWDTTADPQVTAHILERAARMVPELRSARVIGHRVGLRPSRPAVRLEREVRPGASPVVHCYGHGGSGVTLSWGCALEVAELVDSLAE